jgi:hypothetical protein
MKNDQPNDEQVTKRGCSIFVFFHETMGYLTDLLMNSSLCDVSVCNFTVSNKTIFLEHITTTALFCPKMISSSSNRPSSLVSDTKRERAEKHQSNE